MFTEIYHPKEHKYSFTARQAQEMRQQVFDLKLELGLEIEKREQVKGQKKRPFTKRIKEIETELETLKSGLAESPPVPMSNDDAVNLMLERITKHDDDYNKVASKCKEYIDKSSLSWYSYIVKDLFYHEIMYHKTANLREHFNIFELYKAMRRLYSETVERLIESDNIYNSTSEIDNVTSMIEHQVNSKLVRRDLLWWLKECEQLIEQVKAFESLSQTKEN